MLDVPLPAVPRSAARENSLGPIRGPAPALSSLVARRLRKAVSTALAVADPATIWPVLGVQVIPTDIFDASRRPRSPRETVGVPEAARILGVSEQAIRPRLASSSLIEHRPTPSSSTAGPGCGRERWVTGSRRQAADSGHPDVTLHRLRRTVATTHVERGPCCRPSTASGTATAVAAAGALLFGPVRESSAARSLVEGTARSPAESGRFALDTT